MAGHRRRSVVACAAIVACVIGRAGLAEAPGSGMRGKDILAHLNAAIHLYRSATTFTQKAGEPSDALYHDAAVSQATQIVQLAFQSANAEAALLSEQQQAAGSSPSQPSGAESTQQKRLTDLETSYAARSGQLKAQIATITQQMGRASATKYRQLGLQRESLQGQLDLIQTMQQSLERITTFTDANGSSASGLSGDISRLARSVPVASSTASGAAKPVPSAGPPMAFVYGAQSTGVIGQAEILFGLVSNLHQMDEWIAHTKRLRDRATALHAPLVALLRQTIQQGQVLTQNAPVVTPPTPSAKANKATPAQPAPTLQDYEHLVARFKLISAASVPLMQEGLLLDQSAENLQQWRDSMDNEYDGIFRSLLLRVCLIALSIFVVLLLGEGWRRASIRYVQDLRRRRQLLVVRRFVMGFFMGLVLVLGFVTQFSSLATFAGFITAGIAVGLQTVLLSVAAYFFIVGRYGVRIGDRISIAGVTGDVINIGIVRLYILELAGTGMDLSPTGRVAVFSNAVLFQPTTPLYKQVPGTQYGWHEVVVKLDETAEFQKAAKKMTELVTSIYQKYQPEIERQHGGLELRWDIHTERPKIESRLQYADGGLEFMVRYPVLLHEAAEADEALTGALLSLSQTDAVLKAAIQGPPVIRSTVKI